MLFRSDGIAWDRTFGEAWVRPGPDERNWTERSNMPAWGIVESAPGEWSMYISEHYRWPDNRLRRLVLPRHRLASMHAGTAGGAFTTPALRVSGDRLIVNAATSAAGSLRAGVRDEQGTVIPGFSADDCVAFFGDELEAQLTWKKARLAQLRGRVVSLHFVLRDADLFALRFAE